MRSKANAAYSVSIVVEPISSNAVGGVSDLAKDLKTLVAEAMSESPRTKRIRVEVTEIEVGS